MNYFRCGGGRSTHTATKIDVAKTPLATFESNVSGLYLPEILAYISATQSGTGDPSPSNPRAISGVSSVDTTVCGVNIWDEQWEVGGISATTGQNTTATNRIRAKNYIRVSPQTQYYFKASVSFRVFYYTATKEFISATNTTAGNFLFTTPDGVHYMRFILVADTFVQNDVSINYPATATAYHPYTGTTATTALGGTYYGGYLNVTTGVLTVTHGYVDLSSLSYSTTSWGAYRATVSGIKTRSSSIVADGMASNYVITTYSNLNSNKPNNHMAVGSANSYIYIISDSAPTGYFAYELAEEQTYQLTPAQLEQLLGENNVFCSTGDVAVKYWKID